MSRDELREVVCPGCSRPDECNTMEAIDAYASAQNAKLREVVRGLVAALTTYRHGMMPGDDYAPGTYGAEVIAALAAAELALKEES